MFQKFPTKEPFVEFTGFSNFVSKGFDQSKLFETKFEKPVNSTNGSLFQIPNFPPYPPISMFILSKFCFLKPKTLQTTLIWGDRGFYTEKEIFYFVTNLWNCVKFLKHKG